MKTIPLQNSTQVAMVDDEDYDRLKNFRWLESPKGYIIRYEDEAAIKYYGSEALTNAKMGKVG